MKKPYLRGVDPRLRFEQKVERQGDHLIWVGAKGKRGHGNFYLYGESTSAGRASLLLNGVAIPDGHVAIRTCDAEGCVSPQHLRVVPLRSYAREQKTRDWPAYFRERTAVDPETGCWEWQLRKGPDGYGYSKVMRDVTTLAHRVSYLLLAGPIADGLTIDHLCRNRGCVNPEHLEPVTMAENTRRAVPFRRNRGVA